MHDLESFLAVLKSLPHGPCSALRDFLRPGVPAVVARAPGRLDVMGGIADYSGSLVLQLPLAEATLAAVQPADDGQLRIASLSQESGGARTAAFPWAEIAALAQQGYPAARDYFRCNPTTAWAAYVAGVVVVLLRECGLSGDPSCNSSCGQRGGVRFDFGGLRIVVSSQVPEGKGVSSSAALEVATMLAVCGLAGLELPGTEVARLCQMAENRVVGAPCGIMDQMTSAAGRAHALLALLCQPAQIQGFLGLPASLAVWGIDSGIRHAVSGGDYTSVRTGAFMGYRILAEETGLRPREGSDEGVRQFDDPAWHGFLANVGVAAYKADLAELLPEFMPGDEFLAHYGGTTDPLSHAGFAVTRVDPERVYAVRQPTAHPIYEHGRVTRFAELLGHADDAALAEMGQLMYASHESYSACGLGSAGTDRLVEMVRQVGPAGGLFGAKITGGGSGGTVAVLGRSDAGPAVRRMAALYAAETGQGGFVFAGSSPGACEFGLRRYP